MVGEHGKGLVPFLPFCASLQQRGIHVHLPALDGPDHRVESNAFLCGGRVGFFDGTAFGCLREKKTAEGREEEEVAGAHQGWISLGMSVLGRSGFRAVVRLGRSRGWVASLP